MPRRDFEHLLRIVEKKMSDRYLVLNAERYPNYPLMTTRLVKKGTVFVEEVMKDVDCPFGIQGDEAAPYLASVAADAL